MSNDKYTIEYDDSEGKQRAMLEYWFEVMSPMVKKDGHSSQTVIAFCHDEGTAVQIINALNDTSVNKEEEIKENAVAFLDWNLKTLFNGLIQYLPDETSDSKWAVLTNPEEQNPNKQVWVKKTTTEIYVNFRYDIKLKIT